MGNSNLLFVDTGTLLLPEAAQRSDTTSFVQDVLKDAAGKVYLEPTIRATCSGQLIQGRCYTGQGMRNGTPTWTSVERGGSAAYDKPFLVNHDLHGEPLGRVVKSSFTQLKQGASFQDDWQKPDTGLNLGSGFITLVGQIRDADAIQKIADGRYQTVSTSQVPKQAWCSICQESLFTGCDHKIGEYYEAKDGNEYLAYAVTGDLEYIEVSWVNRPRQQNAKVLSFREMSDQLRDSADRVVFHAESTMFFDSVRMGVDGGAPDSLLDLAGDLPATSRITGKTKVSMSKKKIDAAPPVAPKAPEVPVTPPVVDAAPVETPPAPPPALTRPATFDFAFADLAKRFQDLDALDLVKDFEGMAYCCGITENEDGHAHSFSGYYELKTKIFSGYTTTIGQGKADHDHGHSIWADDVSADDGYDGPTRDASAGPPHTHSVRVGMSDAHGGGGRLTAGADEIRASIQSLEDLSQGNLLTDAEKERRTVKGVEGVQWDAEYASAALRILGRVKPGVRDAVVATLVTGGHLQKKADTMKQELLEKAVQGLTDHVDSLKASLATAEAKITALETEKTALADQVKVLPAEIEKARKSTLARLVVSLKGLDAGKIVAADSAEMKDAEKDERPVSDMEKDLDSLLSALPAKLKITGASIVADAAKTAPVALTDSTNKGVPAKNTKKAAPANGFEDLMSQADKFYADKAAK